LSGAKNRGQIDIPASQAYFFGLPLASVGTDYAPVCIQHNAWTLVPVIAL
jgi:hypothetical protein